MTDISKSVGACVIDTDGQSGQIVAVEQNEQNPTVTVQIIDGPEIVLPLSLLSMQDNNEYRLPISFASLSDNADDRQQIVIPVMQEQLEVDKRTVDTGKGVRVHKTVSEHEQVVDQPLLQDELVIEHVPIGQMVADSPLPTARYDGDTLVVPVFEEVLVVEKQTRLKEEVRITRRKREIHVPQTVLLKSEQVSVEHFDEPADSSYPAGIPQTSNQIKSETGKSAG